MTINEFGEIVRGDASAPRRVQRPPDPILNLYLPAWTLPRPMAPLELDPILDVDARTRPRTPPKPKAISLGVVLVLICVFALCIFLCLAVSQFFQ
jgi:hypothetical protein